MSFFNRYNRIFHWEIDVFFLNYFPCYMGTGSSFIINLTSNLSIQSSCKTMVESARYLLYSECIQICLIIFVCCSGSGHILRRTSLRWLVSAVALGVHMVVLVGAEKVPSEWGVGFLGKPWLRGASWFFARGWCQNMGWTSTCMAGHQRIAALS